MDVELPHVAFKCPKGQIKFLKIERVDKVLCSFHTWVLEEGVNLSGGHQDTSADYFSRAMVLARKGMAG